MTVTDITTPEDALRAAFVDVSVKPGQRFSDAVCDALNAIGWTLVPYSLLMGIGSDDDLDDAKHAEAILDEWEVRTECA